METGASLCVSDACSHRLTMVSQDAVEQNAFLHHNVFNFNLAVAREACLRSDSTPTPCPNESRQRWGRVLVGLPQPK